MRPRKVVLLVDADARSLAVMRFVIENAGRYSVIGAATASEALAHIDCSHAGSIDLIVCELFGLEMDASELVRLAKQMEPGLPALIFSTKFGGVMKGHAADAFLPKAASSPAEILKRIKLLVARKRGPKVWRTHSEKMAAKARWRAERKAA